MFHAYMPAIYATYMVHIGRLYVLHMSCIYVSCICYIRGAYRTFVYSMLHVMHI